MNSKLKLKCYVCGLVVDEIFWLVSPRDETDRPFAIHPRCKQYVDQDDNHFLAVKNGDV